MEVLAFQHRPRPFLQHEDGGDETDAPKTTAQILPFPQKFPDKS